MSTPPIPPLSEERRVVSGIPDNGGWYPLGVAEYSMPYTFHHYHFRKGKYWCRGPGVRQLLV